MNSIVASQFYIQNDCNTEEYYNSLWLGADNLRLNYLAIHHRKIWLIAVFLKLFKHVHIRKYGIKIAKTVK